MDFLACFRKEPRYFHSRFVFCTYLGGAGSKKRPNRILDSVDCKNKGPNRFCTVSKKDQTKFLSHKQNRQSQFTVSNKINCN